MYVCMELAIDKRRMFQSGLGEGEVDRVNHSGALNPWTVRRVRVLVIEIVIICG